MAGKIDRLKILCSVFPLSHLRNIASSGYVRLPQIMLMTKPVGNIVQMWLIHIV